jgi:hypothetical protein
MIASEVALCASCGHPVREKEGGWKHTNTMDGHVFSTKACQQCIAEGKDCREASPSEGARVSIQEIPVVPPEKKASEEQYVICSICGIYAKSKAALMRHFRDEHPLDPERLLSLQREGKSIEEMAVILERTPQTVRYHLERLSSDSEPAGHQSVQLEMQSSPDQVAVSGTADLESENRDLRAGIRDLESQIQNEKTAGMGWTRIFSLSSSGDGTHEGIQAVKNAIKSALPWTAEEIFLKVDSNKPLHLTRIFVEVRMK